MDATYGNVITSSVEVECETAKKVRQRGVKTSYGRMKANRSSVKSANGKLKAGGRASKSML